MSNEAIKELHKQNAHLFRCTKEPYEHNGKTFDEKAPILADQKWKDAKPSLDELLQHDGYIGFWPVSLGLLVVDVDEGGERAVKAVSERLGAPLAIAKTRKGYHLFYTAPEGEIRNKKWELDCGSGDIRGSNGYVILWDATATLDAFNQSAQADPPDLELLPKVKKKKTDDGYFEGNRNNQLNEDVFQIYAQAGLSDAERDRKVSEIRQKALNAGLGADEIDATITSAREGGEAKRLDPWDDEFLKTLLVVETPRLLTQASRIEAEPISWLAEGWLAEGEFHLLAGASGTGKSTITNWIAAQVSRGLPLHDGSKVKKGEIAIWTGEEMLSNMVIPRLENFGADMDRVFLIPQEADFYPSDPAHVERLAKELKGMPGVRLLILDPMLQIVSGKRDSYSASVVRETLAPFLKIAKENRIAILGVLHTRKDAASTASVLDRVAGSGAWPQVSRSTYLADYGRDYAGERRVYLTPLKEGRNLPGLPRPYPYRLIEKSFRAELSAVDILWGNEDERDALEIFARVDGRTEKRAEAKETAKGYILEKLKEHLGGLKWDEIVKGGEYSERTLRRARDELDVYFDPKDNKWRLSK